MTDRALSTIVNYSLMLVVIGLLVSGLLVGVNGYVGNQNERVVRSELSVVGNQLAADLGTADRLAGTLNSSGEVEINGDLPNRVGGKPYLVAIDSTPVSDRYAITLTTDNPSVSVTVHVRLTRSVELGRFAGGDVTITANKTAVEVDR